MKTSLTPSQSLSLETRKLSSLQRVLSSLPSTPSSPSSLRVTLSAATGGEDGEGGEVEEVEVKITHGTTSDCHELKFPVSSSDSSSQSGCEICNVNLKSSVLTVEVGGESSDVVVCDLVRVSYDDYVGGGSGSSPMVVGGSFVRGGIKFTLEYTVGDVDMREVGEGMYKEAKGRRDEIVGAIREGEVRGNKSDRSGGGKGGFLLQPRHNRKSSGTTVETTMFGRLSSLAGKAYAEGMRLAPAFKNYIVFGIVTAMAHWKGHELGLPSPV